MSRVAVEDASGVRRDAVTAAKLQIFPVKHKQESPDPDDRRADRCAPDRNMLGVREQNALIRFDDADPVPSDVFCQSVSSSAFGCAYSVGLNWGKNGPDWARTSDPALIKRML